jgi:hypothetical protein
MSIHMIIFMLKFMVVLMLICTLAHASADAHVHTHIYTKADGHFQDQTRMEMVKVSQDRKTFSLCGLNKYMSNTWNSPMC